MTRIISKEFLQSVGIVNVTEDGEVFTKKGKLNTYPLIKHHKYGKTITYMCISVYDRALYEYQKKHCKAAPGNRMIPLNRVVYAWFNNEIPAGYDVDHINNDTLDNRLSNLQLLSRKDNLRKRGVPKNQYTVNMSDDEYKLYISIKSDYLQHKQNTKMQIEHLKNQIAWLSKDLTEASQKYKETKQEEYRFGILYLNDRLNAVNEELEVCKNTLKYYNTKLKQLKLK